MNLRRKLFGVQQTKLPLVLVWLCLGLVVGSSFGQWWPQSRLLRWVLGGCYFLVLCWHWWFEELRRRYVKVWHFIITDADGESSNDA